MKSKPANLGFAARIKSEEDRRREHELKKKSLQPPLSEAAFELLCTKHATTVSKLKQLHFEVEINAREEREARAEMSDLEEQSREVLEMLSTFDISPASW